VPREFLFIPEDSDLWEFRPTEFGLAPPKGHKRRKRNRRLTLARAIVEARKTGVVVRTITIDGATLTFGNQTDVTDNTLDDWMRRHAH
jgi:hypothetical protein